MTACSLQYWMEFQTPTLQKRPLRWPLSSSSSPAPDDDNRGRPSYIVEKVGSLKRTRESSYYAKRRSRFRQNHPLPQPLGSVWRGKFIQKDQPLRIGWPKCGGCLDDLELIRLCSSAKYERVPTPISHRSVNINGTI
jgi:hypothetical protein